MLEQVYGEGTVNIRQALYGLSDFKSEGKVLHMMKDSAIQQLKGLMPVWKK
jgi:hypothetical protein